MDQLKVVWTVVKKHHFWALVAAVLVVSLLSWTWARAELTNKFSQRKDKLDGMDGAFQSVGRITGEPNHPNEQLIAEIEGMTEDLKQRVYKSWETLYSQQKEKNLLPEKLTDEFNKEFADLRPGDDLPRHLREEYRNFILDHFDKLFADIDLLRPVGSGEGGAGSAGVEAGAASPAGPMAPGNRDGGAEGTEDAKDVQYVGTVDWDEQDRTRIRDRFRWSERPDTLQVILAQEDLWVYEALLRIIKNTNDDTVETVTHENAAVKRIETLQIGQDVAGVDNTIGGGAARRAETAQGGSAAASQFLEALTRGRYVDDQGKPIAVAPYPFAEYDGPYFIMPIRMRLIVDQTKIPKLLAECNNSNMPIEVQRFRIRPGEGRQLNLAPSGPRAGQVGPRNAPPGVFDAPGAGPVAVKRDEGKSGLLDVPIEIEGVIYIYTPPDAETLGKPATSEPTAEAADAATSGEGQTTGPAGAGQPPGTGG